MPKRARKICAAPGCPDLALANGSLCEAHEQARVEKYNARRPSASALGYDAHWRAIRAAHLAEHPLCVECGKPGTHVDHILAKVDGGADDEANLQTLCARHHSIKTATHDGGFGNAKRAVTAGR